MQLKQRKIKHSKSEYETYANATARTVIEDYVKIGVPKRFFKNLRISVKEGPDGKTESVTEGEYKNGLISILDTSIKGILDIRAAMHKLFTNDMEFIDDTRDHLRSLRVSLDSTMAHELVHHIITVNSGVSDDVRFTRHKEHKISMIVSDEALCSFAADVLVTNRVYGDLQHLKKFEDQRTNNLMNFVRIRRLFLRGRHDIQIRVEDDAHRIVETMGYMAGHAAAKGIMNKEKSFQESLLLGLLLEKDHIKVISRLAKLAESSKLVSRDVAFLFNAYMSDVGISMQINEDMPNSKGWYGYKLTPMFRDFYEFKVKPLLRKVID